MKKPQCFLLILSSLVLLGQLTMARASSKSDVLFWAENLASQGQGIDYDGVYGMQCVDLVNGILGHYFKKPIWGNAIELLSSAQEAGYTVIYNNGQNTPEAGDLFVMRLYNLAYGHAGLIVGREGTRYRTIEQNVDGGATTLTIGGPARRLVRSLSDASGDIIGWIRPPYTESDTPPISPDLSDEKIRDEQGRFTVTVAQLHVRSNPSTLDTPVATYQAGETIYYDSIYRGNGYRWLSYISYSGVRRYVAQGPEQAGNLSTTYGQTD